MRNEELLLARKFAGLTQEQAAERMGVCRATFIRWEHGTTPIRPGTLYRFLAMAAPLAGVEASPRAERASPKPTRSAKEASATLRCPHCHSVFSIVKGE